MTPKSLIEYLVYALIILLVLIVFALLAISPSGISESKSVYQGF